MGLVPIFIISHGFNNSQKYLTHVHVGALHIFQKAFQNYKNLRKSITIRKIILGLKPDRDLVLTFRFLSEERI